MPSPLPSPFQVPSKLVTSTDILCRILEPDVECCVRQRTRTGAEVVRVGVVVPGQRRGRARQGDPRAEAGRLPQRRLLLPVDLRALPGPSLDSLLFFFTPPLLTFFSGKRPWSGLLKGRGCKKN